jgi:hypothetical protein
MRALKQLFRIKHPILVFSSVSNISSTKIEKKIGDKTPPCRTPLVILKGSE